MKYYNYQDLNIVSSKKPINTHLFIETNSSGTIYLVDSADQTKVYKTTDKGDNWSLIETRSKKIQSLWYDGSYIWGIDCDNDGVDDDYNIWKLDVGTDSCADVGTYTGNTANGITAFDIFKIGENVYALHERLDVLYVYDVDSDPFSLKDSWATAGIPINNIGYGVVNGSDYYVFGERRDALDSGQIEVIHYLDTTPILEGTQQLDDYLIPDSENLRSTAFDGSNIINIIGKHESVGNNYLISYNIKENSLKTGAVYNIALMLDRNSNDLEKAFHITDYKLYQLHPNSPHQLYQISNVNSDNTLIAISDNFLMNDDGDMFEYTDLSDKITKANIKHKVRDPSKGELSFLSDYIDIEKGMITKIQDNYNSSGIIAEDTIFYQYCEKRDYEKNYKAEFKNPISEFKEIRPYGDYSGTTDEIIVDLLELSNFARTGDIDKGTISGNYTFKGDKTLYTILNELSNIESKNWYPKSEGEVNWTNGRIQAGITFSNNNRLLDIKAVEPNKIHNKLIFYGGITGSTQISGVYDDEESQQLYGVIPYKLTHSHILDQGILDSGGQNILDTLTNPPLVIKGMWRNTATGMLQVGESITIGTGLYYKNSKEFVPTGSYIIQENNYDPLTSKNLLSLASGIILTLQEEKSLEENLSLQIQQAIANVTTEGSNYDADLLIGKSNAEYVPCVLEGLDNNAAGNVYYMFRNAGTATVYPTYKLPMPINRGGKHLHISGLRLDIYDADADDYVSAAYVKGIGHDKNVYEYSNSTDRKAPGSYEYDVEFDASGYQYIVVAMFCNVTTANELDIAGVALRCYYDN